ncbi:uncharacterized protein N7515_002111 [Penicillium bovifimosum]|uniref:Uncharacterized protein n=1 Tax=Penicillium bovifimosum TaxID=126998 RepID=A0A9W9L9D2_9EURO|nr:uncharacterized protein N7515_002111 [Penicillium bovifimosum]KAJ5143324.1 hypothetical protein N7515_002111 [Penicillium bovifimosum]
MRMYSLFLATIALAIGAHALPQTTGETTDASTCLRLCRDEPVSCPDQWKSTQITSDGEDCWTCCAVEPAKESS